MAKFTTYEFRIPAHYLSYLVNEDASSLSDSELSEIQSFEAQLPGIGHWAIDNDSEEFYSNWNDVNNLGSSCEDVKYLARKS